MPHKITAAAIAAILLSLAPIVWGAADLMTHAGYRRAAVEWETSNKVYDQLPATLETPHIAWAEGASYRGMKLLVILPTWASREAVELKQRFGADVTVIMTHSHDFWATNDRPYAEEDAVVLDRLALLRLNRPEPYDAIIIGKVTWKAIPDSVQQLIMKQVLGGTGLVYVSPRDLDERLTEACGTGAFDADKPAITNGVPLEILPLENKERKAGPLEIRLGQTGGGRVVLLDYRDFAVRDNIVARGLVGPNSIALTPFVEDDDLFYEYYYSLLGKAILWAARHPPEISVQTAGGATVQRTALPAAPVTFRIVTEKKADAAPVCHYEVRNRDNQVVLSGEAKPVADDNGTLVVSPRITPLPTGLYVVDLWVKNSSDVLAWSSSSLTIGGDDLISLRADQESFPRGQPITGAVSVLKQLPAGATLTVELSDSYQRLVERQKLTPVVGEVKFALTVVHPLSRIYTISAVVTDKNGPVEIRKATVGVPDNTLDDYIALIWASGTQNRAARILMEQSKRYGVNGFYDGACWAPEPVVRASSTNLAAANIFAQPYTEHVTTGHWQKTMDEERKRYGAESAFNGKAYGRYGTILYSICEENVLARDNQDYENPATLAEYRAYMQKQFETLEKMNAVWNSDYKTWDDLHMIALVEAKLKNRFPQYVSQELYKQDRFMIIHEFVAEQIRSTDPQARISIDIAVGNDFDWGRMAEYVSGGWAISEMVPFLRYRADTYYGEGIGYNPGQLDEFRMRYWPWRALFEGGHFIFWWPISAGQGLGGACAFTPDCSEPVRGFEQMCEEVSRIDRGVGKLLTHAAKKQAPILVFFSNVSCLAGFLNNRETTWNDSRTAFYTMLDKLCLPYRAISGKELAALNYGADAKVLILPYTQAMSKAEVEAVKRFVTEGGFAIADYTPAIFDEYCRPYGKMDVVQPGTEQPCKKCGGKGRFEEASATVTAWQTCPVCGGAGKTVEGRDVRYSGSALTEVFGAFEPMRLGAYGKGKTLYIGQPFSKPGDWDGIGFHIGKQAGIKRPFDVKTKAGNTRYDSYTAQYECGQTKLFCLLGESITEGLDPDVMVTLDGKYHVYDVLRQTYLGYVDTFQTGISPAAPRVFAGLPGKIEALNVPQAKLTLKPGKTGIVSVSLLPKELAGAQLCVRFDVFSPDGERLPQYSKKILSDTGQFDLTIPTALNEKPGRYRVDIEEVVSGLKKQAYFTVKN